MTCRQPTRKCGPAAVAFAAALAFVAYINVLPNDLVWDSDQLCLRNPCLVDLETFLPMLAPWKWEANRRMMGGSYRPAAYLSFFVERRVWREAAWGYHLTNVLTHALNAVIVCWLARQLGWSVYASSVAGAVFALHAVNTEAVAWVENRSMLLATGLAMLSLGLFARSFSARGTRFHAYASVAALVLGLLANEGVMLVPLFAGLWLIGQGIGRRGARRLLWLLLASGVYMALRAGTTSIGPPPWSRSPMPLAEPRALVVMRTTGAYASMLAAPWGLSADRRLSATAPNAVASAVWVAALVLVLAAGRLRRRSPAYPVWLMLVLLAPVSNVVYLAGRPLAEQRAYPMAAAAAILAGHVLGRGRRLLALGMCIALAALTLARNPAWATELALWTDTVAKTPTKARAFLNLGLAQERSGRSRRALPHYRRAAELYPGYALARLKWASLVAEQGRHHEARAVLEVLPTRQWGAEYWGLVAQTYLATGRRRDGLNAYQTALGMGPHIADLRARFARALALDGQTEQARALLREGLAQAQAEPVLVAALAQTYALEAAHRDAVGLYLQAVRRDPKSPSAILGLGRCLAELHDDKKAAWVLGDALAVDPYSADAYRLLGQVSQRLGLPDEAQRCLHAVARLTPSPEGADL